MNLISTRDVTCVDIFSIFHSCVVSLAVQNIKTINYCKMVKLDAGI